MKNQKGFSLALVLILIAALAAIGFAFWKVNSSQKSSGTSQTNNTNQEEEPDTTRPETNMSESWLLRESSEASIRVPDGFNILATQGQPFDFTLPDEPQGTLKYTEGELAKVVGEPAKHFQLGLIVGFGKEGLNDRGVQTREFKTYSGQTVTVKEFKQTTDPGGLDIPKGAIQLKYTVKSNSKYINVDYVYLGDGLVSIIDEMVKSADIK